MNFLAIIPARGGSKGIPRKNIRLLLDKPLIAWTIEEAKKSSYINRIILISEDEEIITVAKKYGAETPCLIPSEMTQDDTPIVVPVTHVIKNLSEKYDYLVLLQPTSPLRLVADIDECIEFCIKYNASGCTTVMEVDKHPYKMCTFSSGRSIHPLYDRTKWESNRQELPEVYALNGAVYVTKIQTLLEQKTFYPESMIAYRMPPERSIDIDSEMDLLFCESILRKRLEDS